MVILNHEFSCVCHDTDAEKILPLVWGNLSENINVT